MERYLKYLFRNFSVLSSLATLKTKLTKSNLLALRTGCACVTWILISSCSTLLTGMHETLIIKVVPTSAKVVFEDGQSCTSPCRKRVKRSQEVSFVVESTNCQKIEKTIPPKPAPHGTAYPIIGFGQIVWGLGNERTTGRFLVYSLVGLMVSYVDVWSRATFTKRENPVIVELDCSKSLRD